MFVLKNAQLLFVSLTCLGEKCMKNKFLSKIQMNLKHLIRSAYYISTLTLLTLFPSLSYSDSLEDKTKAVFIYKLKKLVKWKGKSEEESANRENLVFCSYSNFQFFEHLEYIKNKRGGIDITVLNPESSIDKCFILYIGKKEVGVLENVPSNEKEGLLLISDHPNFYQSSGMISFYFKDGKFLININKTNINKANMRINSKLLRIATHIK